LVGFIPSHRSIAMFFIGIDVSKAKLDCSLLLLDVASSKRRAKSVTNSKTGITDLLAWCAKQQVIIHELHAIMEGTGVYHEQAALALSDAGVTISIVNPAQVKDFGRSLLACVLKPMASTAWYWPVTVPCLIPEYGLRHHKKRVRCKPC
jgi:hypothetical protein